MADKLPNWKDMPDDRPILWLGWKDIYASAEANGKKLTRDECIRYLKGYEIPEHLLRTFIELLDRYTGKPLDGR